MNKEQKKKIVLGGLGLAALVYVYFSFFIGPLNRTRADIARHIGETQAKTASSKADIERARKIEQNARTSLERSAALRALNPDGAPIAWFPPRLRTFFASQQIDHATVRLEASAPLKEKDLESWQRYRWLIELPQTDYHVLGKAVAELENKEPLLVVNRISIHSATAEPELQQVSLAAASLIEKR